MTKKICATLLSVIVFLYAVSFGFVFKLGLDAKLNEYYDRDTETTRYGMKYYQKAYKNGELSFEDTVTALCEYDLLITHIPMAAYNMIFDKEGNVLAESSSLLEVRFYDGDTEEKHFINLDPYMTEEVKEQILEVADEEIHSEYWIDKVELYRDGDTIIPVAFTNNEYGDNFEIISTRIVLSDSTANITSSRGEYEEFYFRFFAHNLDGKMKKHHEYLKSIADSYCQRVKNGENIEDFSEGGGEEPYIFSERSVGVFEFKLGGEKYYFFCGEATNTVLAVLEDEDYKKTYISMAAIYAVIGYFLCFYGVGLYNKKEEEEKYKDKYTGIV